MLQAVSPSIVLRVVLEGRPQFQLRAGEDGLSVFDADMISEDELLADFREQSRVVMRRVNEINRLGLDVVRTPGDPLKLSTKAHAAHCEIVPGPGMTRNDFKRALRKLESRDGG